MGSTYTRTDGTEVTRLSTAETAKFVRRDLKARWPRCKFSVRSHNYPGGSSIYVRWTDGPTVAEVDALVKQYEGADFDGMIDLKSYKDPSLVVDESGELKNISWGTDWVSTSRELSDEVLAELTKELEFVSERQFDGSGDYSDIYVDRDTGQAFQCSGQAPPFNNGHQTLRAMAYPRSYYGKES